MVDNASELAERLSRLGPSVIRLGRVVFDSETHASVTQAALSRALRFALVPK
jgi:hypothetical protein